MIPPWVRLHLRLCIFKPPDSGLSMSRASVISGRYYPATREDVCDVIKGLAGPGPVGANDIRPSGQGQGQGQGQEADVVGVMVPHASIDFCGPVAAAAWRQIKVPSTVVVIGPNHTGLGARVAVYGDEDYGTPAGPMTVDRTLARALAGDGGLLEIDSCAHEEEHSIEAVLPFIQVLNPAARVVPICVRSLTLAQCSAVADSLFRAITGPDVDKGGVLVVASSDMNHSEPVRSGQRRDRLALDRIEALDPAGLFDAVVSHHLSMCGVSAVVIMMYVALRLGARFAETVAYSTSMRVTGDPSAVVGYASAVFRRRVPVGTIGCLRDAGRTIGGVNGKS